MIFPFLHSIDVPLILLNEINEQEQQLKQIEAELAQLEWRE
jgi:hypothetical protein